VKLKKKKTNNKVQLYKYFLKKINSRIERVGCFKTVIYHEDNCQLMQINNKNADGKDSKELE
jgi:hypothetical protein